MRRFSWVPVVLALGALLFWALRAPALRVETARAERGPLRVTVDEEGKTRVRDRFVIAAPVSGRVERIPVHRGDPVEPGTVTARIHPAPLDPRSRAEASARLDAAMAAKREADARAEQARAALAQAQRSAQRARQLAARGVMSAQELEFAELEETTRGKELEAATFAARAADYNVHAARAALLSSGGGSEAPVAPCNGGASSCIELRAPVRGQVLQVPEESERVVAVGTPLVEIGDPAALEVVVDVLSADAVKVRPGALAVIDGWGGDTPLEARVRLVEPSGFTKLSALGVEEQRVNVIADFVDAPDSLGDGYRVEARIVVWEGLDVLKVPSSAIFRRRGSWNVFVVAGGVARRREVEVGHRSAIEVEVRAGLDPGDAVILHPSDQVDDGARVKPL